MKGIINNNSNEQQFTPRAYPKSELALLYFPQSTPATAMAHLRNWIKRNKRLSEALAAAGYRPVDKYFTRQQVALITDYIGEP